MLQASVRLQQAEVQALRTGEWDEDTFEHLVLDFCQAVHEAARAVPVRLDRQHEEQVVETVLRAPTAEPATPTARWHFARWLYQQGRISEGDRDDDASW